MVDGNEIEILLVHKKYKKDGVDKESLSGYVTCRGKPVLKAVGSRVSDYKKTLDDGTLITYPRFALSFGGTEDKKKLFEDEVLFLRLHENKTGLRLTTDFHKVGEGDSVQFFPGFTPNLFNLVVPMSGWISKETKTDRFGEQVGTIRMTFNEFSYVRSKVKDRFKVLDLKSNLTDEQLDQMEKAQFPYFASFKELFDDNKKAAEAPSY